MLRVIQAAFCHFSLLLVLTYFQIAHANPAMNSIVSGNVSTQTMGNTLQINQTSTKAIINWQSFNINANETTHFNQPVNGITLNRVNAANGISNIFGQLTATGKIILINPAGIYFGPSAYVNVGGLIASTSEMNDQHFLEGNYIFDKPSAVHGTIVNRGTIIAANNGLVALIGANISNEGKIQANYGHIILASGSKFTIDMRGDDLIHFTIDEKSSGSGTNPEGKTMRNGVNNSGQLIANGGTVILSAQSARHVIDRSINMSGYIEANSVSQRNGVIILSGGSNGKVRVSGTLVASGMKGGTIKILGKKINIKSTAKIDASGEQGGGEILIGGNFQGKGSESNAKQTTIAANATIKADALVQGDGGKIIIWSDKLTDYAGNISAKGGVKSGNGGFVEVSSRALLKFNGNINLTAPHGITGTLLLDPENLTIQNAGPTSATPSGSPINSYTANVNDSILTVADLQNALLNANVLVQTGSGLLQAGDITVADNVVWNTAHSLTLSAYHSINFAAGVTVTNTAGASINLNADNTGQGSGTVNFASGSGVVLTGGGAVNIYYNPSNYTSPTNYNSFVTGAIPTAYMLVNNASNLQSINTNLNGNYALGKNILWSGNFIPLGSNITPFTGKFNGQNYTIDHLNIVDATANGSIGLFGYISNAVIANVNLTNTVITETANAAAIGGVIGDAENATISNVISSASINVTTDNVGHSMYIGGLIGLSNNSSISNSQTNTIDINVTGTNYGIVGSTGRVGIGGLIGHLSGGTVTASHSTNGTIHSNVNAVSVTNQSARNNIGGLIGGASNSAVIANSDSNINIIHQGNVTSNDATAQLNIGGLVGRIDTSAFVNNSHSSGALTITSILSVPTTGSGYVFTGGLVGNVSLGNVAGVSNSYSSSNIVLTATVNNTVSPPAAYFMTGGLTGQANGDIDNSYTTGNITANLNACTSALGSCTAPATNYAFYVGGIAGDAFSYITNSYSSGKITVSGINSNGDFGVGGIVGTHITLYDRGLINLSRSGDITIDVVNINSGRIYVGGLAGSLVYYGTPTPGNPAFDNIYSSSVIHVAAQNNGSYISVGGLVGNNGLDVSDPGGKIDRALVTGYVNTQITDLNAGTSYTGGFIGFLDNDVTASVTRSFWDTDMTGFNQNQAIGNSPGAYAGLTPGCFGGNCANGGTANLSDQQTFANAGWNFLTTWGIIDHYSYPYLLAANPATPQVFSGTFNLIGRNTVKLVSNGSVVDSVISTNNGFYYFSEANNTITNSGGLIYIANNSFPGNIVLIPSSNQSFNNLTITLNTLQLGTSQLMTFSNAILANIINGLGVNNDILYSSSGNTILLGNAAHLNPAMITTSSSLYQLDGAISQPSGASTSLTFIGNVSLVGNASLSANTVQFSNAISAPSYDFTVSAVNNIVFDGNVSLANLIVNANTITLNNTSMLTTGSQTYNGVVTLNADTIMQGSAIYLNGGINGNHQLILQGQSGDNYFSFAGNINVAALGIIGSTDGFNSLDLSRIAHSVMVTLFNTHNGTAFYSNNNLQISFSNLSQIIGNEVNALHNTTVLPNKANQVVVNSINDITINDPMILQWFNLLTSQSGMDTVTFNTPAIYNLTTGTLTLNGKVVIWSGFNPDLFQGDITFYQNVSATPIDINSQVLASIDNWMQNWQQFKRFLTRNNDSGMYGYTVDWLCLAPSYVITQFHSGDNSFNLQYGRSSVSSCKK